jgi:epoxyqueuosine reductase QueG
MFTLSESVGISLGQHFSKNKTCMNNKKRNDAAFTNKLKGEIMALGADLVGVADVKPFNRARLTPPDLLKPYVRAISISVRLPTAVFEQIIDRPTPLYASVYQTANRLLDHIAFRTAGILQNYGFDALPIPASQVLDKKNWYGAISHKAVGRMAGLGWQGKSLLLVNPQYGPRIRLVTVLTNALLNIDGPIKNRCGKCTLCRDACPVGAIKGAGTKQHYRNRSEAIHLGRCAEKLAGEFSKLPNVGAPICGICIKVCPFGRRSA